MTRMTRLDLIELSLCVHEAIMILHQRKELGVLSSLKDYLESVVSDLKHFKAHEEISKEFQRE